MDDARASVLMQPEAERMVEDIRLLTIEEIGTAAWTKQHQSLEKLNMQAQICVMNQADEFVVEALIDHEKVPILIHDLLVTEAWKEKVLPLVQEELAGAHYVKLYLIMYHESIVLGLLEKAFFTATAVAAGGDLLVELADYCYRRTVFLNNVDPQKVAPPTLVSISLSLALHRGPLACSADVQTKLPLSNLSSYQNASDRLTCRLIID